MRDVGQFRGMFLGLVVADEAQNIKNPRSMQAAALRQLNAGLRVAVTGTPVENSVTDLWAILDWTNPGLFGTAKDFRAASDLNRLVAPFLLRRRKTDPAIAAELPGKIVSDHIVELTPEQTALYTAVTRDTFGKIRASSGIQRRGLVLRMLQALRQICNSPAHYLRERPDGWDPGSEAARSGKLAALDGLLAAIAERGEASLVFTSYVSMAHLLAAHLSARGIQAGIVHGGIQAARRQEMVDRFQSGEGQCLILSVRAAGVGLNLTRADHVIHFDRHWNPAVEDQATDRAHRIGRRETVHVHHLIAENTVEDHIGALSALVDQLAGPRERPTWFGPSIGRMLRQQASVIAATSPRELEQAVAELAGAEVYWALNEAKRGLWFEWWFEELVQAAADRVKAEAAGEGGGWQAPWRLLHGLAAIGSPALRTAAMQAVKDAGRALTRQQSSEVPDWLGPCPDGAVTGGIWAMRDDYRTRFAVLAECGYPGGVAPHVFLLDIDACVTVTPADAAVFDSLDQAVTAWREGKGDTARTALPGPVTDYSQLGFLVRCDASPNGPFRGDESRGYADNLFRISRRIHDIADAMAGRGHQWPDVSGSHRDHAATAEVMAKAFGDWYARRHGREPGGEAVRWLAGDWVTGGTLPGYENAVSPHRVRALLAYMDDDWLPEEPATAAAYELLPEWVRWSGEQAGIPGPLVERSVAIAERRQSDTSDCPSFRFRPRPGSAPSHARGYSAERAVLAGPC